MNSFSHFCPDLAVTVHEPFFGWGNSSTTGACFVVFWSQIFFFGSTAGDALRKPRFPVKGSLFDDPSKEANVSCERFTLRRPI